MLGVTIWFCHSRIRRNIMNKIIHGLVLAFFGPGCLFVWLILKLPAMVAVKTGQALPAFTRFCMGLGPVLLAALAIAAAAYCIYVWIQKAQSRPSWIAFLATNMSALILVTLPTIIAIYLPIISGFTRN
jgi:hypothetical protein